MVVEAGDRQILRQLAPRLRPRYVALPEERYVVEIQDTRSSPVPHVTVEIRSTDGRRLVTAIEILSPTNKRGDGRKEYLTRRMRILRSMAHLLEIDLLRKGQRVPMQQALPDKSYFVFLSRAEERPLSDVWPITLHQTLPAVPVAELVPGGIDGRSARYELNGALVSLFESRLT